MQVLEFLMCISQLQPDLTLGQVTLHAKELLGDVIDLLLGPSMEVLQGVHQCPLAPKMVNLPMKPGVSFYHEGLVHRKLLRCSFLQLLPHGRRHVDRTSGPPPHIDWGGPNLLSLTVGPKDHGVVWRILDIGGQAQSPALLPLSCRSVVGVLDMDGVEHTSQRVIGDVPNGSLFTFFVVLLHLPLVIDGAHHRRCYFHNRDGPSP